MTFSIIVVCLNAGEKLRETIESIRSQTEQDYEIIIKDGESTDEITQTCLNSYREENHTVQGKDRAGCGQIRVYCSKDTGIYDAMNQAVQYVCGDYVLFLNCGDSFYDDGVLERVKEQILQAGKHRTQVREESVRVGMQSVQQSPQISETLPSLYIFYGNIHERRTNTLVQSNPIIDDFACYRNVPCHQVCFYAADLLRKRTFDTAYTVRADYEHFLWCYYKGGAKTVYMPVTVAFYEGGGFSETRENEKKSRQEHKEIVSIYMSAAKVRKYHLIMLVSLAPVRTWIARNPVTAGIYQTIKKKLYRKEPYDQ